MSVSALETPLEPDEPGTGTEASHTWRSTTGGWLLAIAVALWLSSLRDIDLRAMTDVGLLSVLPTTFFLALALLTVGFVFVLEHQPEKHRLVAAYLATFSAAAHATPAILYGTVRYSWSWKHLGIVDYIQRTGSVDPDAAFLQIYHGWPGVFSATAWLADITGIDPQTIAIWTPVTLSLLSLAALSVVFRLFVDDPRTVALALWLFVIANWVGQEYFSPQGVTYTMYLGLLAIALPLERRAASDDGRFTLQADVGVTTDSKRARLVMRLAILAIVVAIVASHQLTPIMVVVTFLVVAAMRVARTAWISVATVAAMLAWISGPAFTYIRENALDATDTFGSPAATTGESVLDTARISVGQAIVVVADRFLAEALLVLAIVGLVVVWRRGKGVIVLGSLLAAPIALLLTDYGGEVLFRSYLFASPWIALCGAIGLMATTDGSSSNLRIGLRSLVATVLVVAFLFAYLGKERTNYFTPDEIAVTTWLYENAPPNTLLIEGTPNYPGQALNYENFFYVPISREPDSSIAKMNADPEAQLHRWMTNDEYDASYFILTRGMYNEQRSIPSVPDGMFERMDVALRASDRFEIVQSNSDATVWTIVDEVDP